jgi:hypothetical protein
MFDSLTRKRLYLSIIIGVTYGLFLDTDFTSNFVSPWIEPLYFQILISLVAARKFYKVFRVANKRVKQFMIYAFFVGICLEILATTILGMYQYRLENIPLYVPFGHAIIYITGYYFAKELYHIKNRELVETILVTIAVFYALLWYIFANDELGLLGIILFMGFYLYNKESRLFMLIIFYFVTYVELLATYIGVWTWAEVSIFGLHSANPPSSVGMAYVILDGLCMLLYKQFHPKAMERFKRIKK